MPGESRSGAKNNRPTGAIQTCHSHTYDDPMFAAVTDAARVIVDEVAALASPLERQRMRGAFSTASRYEWMFWDAAWRQETWPV